MISKERKENKIVLPHALLALEPAFYKHRQLQLQTESAAK